MRIKPLNIAALGKDCFVERSIEGYVVEKLTGVQKGKTNVFDRNTWRQRKRHKEGAVAQETCPCQPTLKDGKVFHHFIQG